MKKVLLIASEYAPGMLSFASSIINRLSESSEFEVYAVVVSRGKFKYEPLLCEKAKKKTICIEAPANCILEKLLFKIWPSKLISNINKTIRDNHIECIHFLTIDFTLTLFIYLKLRGNNSVYYTVHDLWPHEVERKSLAGRLISCYINWSTKINMKIIPNLTTSSRTQYIALKDRYPSKKVNLTCFPTLVTSQIVSGERVVRELNGITNYILFFGSVDKYKGVDLLLNAYRLLRNKNSFLVVAGKGIQYFDTNIQKGEIRINRFIEDSELKYLYENAAIVVYPYRSATMSGVLSLAYYFKKKLLVSDIPFFIDNISLQTSVFQSGNIYDLSEKIRVKLNEKSHIGDSGYYEKLYSTDTLITGYKHLYNKS